MKGAGTLLLGLFLGVSLTSHCEASTNFYVDPDWTGVQVGTASQPWRALNAAAWNSINSALANDAVTIYFSALKADGVTQQSKVWFVQCRRTDYTAHRLTLDGYTFYNSNETTPNWLANPDNDIAHAYLNGKVFKIIGGDNPIDGSMALGWTRVDGNDFVTRNGLVYCCIESHLASSDNEPGVGPNWQLYWDQHGSSGGAWSSGSKYKCYVKQNNITLRGFEITGRRSVASGDNLIWEYNWIHDTTDIGPGLTCPDYTSYPDGSAAQIIQRPSTNITLHHFRIERTYGEGIYLGSINPDATAAFQLAHGNQHSHILIEDFLIDHPGVNGGQGDAIDCKHGITYLTIRLGEIRGFGVGGDGINLPMTATNVDQHNLIERNFIHDSNHDNFGAQIGIYAATDCNSCTSLYGLNGYTIRNNIVANCRRGIQFSGSTTPNQPATNGYVFNNTIYNVTPDPGLGVATNVSNCVVKNNFVFGGANPRGVIGSSGVVSDYNAHDGTWTSKNEGTHTLALTTAQALAAVLNPAGGDFHLRPGAPVIGKAKVQTSFSDDYSGVTRDSSWDVGAFQATPSQSDFNNDAKPDFVLFNSSTRQTVIWYLNNDVVIGHAYGPRLWSGWSLVGVADFNGDGKPDYLLYNPITRQTVIWYLNNDVVIGHAYGPALWSGWSLVAP